MATKSLAALFINSVGSGAAAGILIGSYDSSEKAKVTGNNDIFTSR
jgi:hypothetical protein